MKDRSWKKYYGENGRYLQEHQDFLSVSKTKSHGDFIIKALALKKTDKIIDLACGEGRITIELARRGFNVEGVDFSKSLLQVAKKKAEENDLSIRFYLQDLHHLSLKSKYDKAFLFFSHLGILDPKRVFEKINQVLVRQGKFLLDSDNLFRLITFLLQTKDKNYFFDPTDLKLYDQKSNLAPERYYFHPEAAEMMFKSGFKPIKSYGDYKSGEYLISSPRMIIIGKKVRQ